jgi:hypothetical protein
MKLIKWILRITIPAYAVYGAVLLIARGDNAQSNNSFEAIAMYLGFFSVGIGVTVLAVGFVGLLVQGLEWIFTDK